MIPDVLVPYWVPAQFRVERRSFAMSGLVPAKKNKLLMNFYIG
jgi:hypothetical protein